MMVGVLTGEELTEVLMCPFYETRAARVVARPTRWTTLACGGRLVNAQPSPKASLPEGHASAGPTGCQCRPHGFAHD